MLSQTLIISEKPSQNAFPIEMCPVCNHVKCTEVIDIKINKNGVLEEYTTCSNCRSEYSNIYHHDSVKIHVKNGVSI